MKYQWLLFVLNFVFGLQAIASQKICEVDLQKISECVGKLSEIVSTFSEQVSQHPMNFGRLVKGKMVPYDVIYLDLGGTGELPVFYQTSKYKEIKKCKGKVQAIGMLEMVDLGGNPGTKESYKNPQMSAHSLKCLK